MNLLKFHFRNPVNGAKRKSSMFSLVDVSLWFKFEPQRQDNTEVHRVTFAQEKAKKCRLSPPSFHFIPWSFSLINVSFKQC